MTHTKKIICLALCLACIVTLLCGCGSLGYNEYNTDNENSDGRMTVIFNNGYAIIYRDNETGVQYFSKYRCGSCVMVNADGTPYIAQKGDE